MSRQSGSRQELQTPLVVVESHQHVLEHIHHVLRKNRGLLKGWNLVHYDAHPDMACSLTIPANFCFAPRLDETNSLYDRLDETSTGISEWILPLFLAASLQNIHWIKPIFSQQLPMGISTFNVGVFTGTQEKVESFLELNDRAVVRVDFNHPYYMDDKVVENNLHLTKKVNLKVSHAEEGVFDSETTAPWMLDICLDYFVCQNPFVTDIQNIDEEFSKVVVSLQQKGTAIAQESNEYLLRRDQFFNAFRSFLLKTDQGQKLKQYFGKQDIGKDVEDLQEILFKYPKLREMTVDALPYLSMPHNFQLPSLDVIEESVNLAIREIQTIKNRPFLITIARSSDDGFCPQSLVDKLQSYLLEKLHALYCGDDCPNRNRCKLRIIRDYGEWEGSTLEMA